MKSAGKAARLRPGEPRTAGLRAAVCRALPPRKLLLVRRACRGRVLGRPVQEDPEGRPVHREQHHQQRHHQPRLSRRRSDLRAKSNYERSTGSAITRSPGWDVVAVEAAAHIANNMIKKLSTTGNLDFCWFNEKNEKRIYPTYAPGSA